jgi:hypothetical protein
MKTTKKLEFNILNLTEETPKEIIKLQNVAKGIIGTVTGVTWFASSPNYAGILAILGAVIIELIGCYSIKEINNEN